MSRLETAPGFIRIPDDHAIERHAHLEGGVAAEMLIGQHHQLFTALPGPGHDRSGVGGRAHDAAVLADEGFHISRRVDVGDRDHAVDVDAHVPQLAPAHLELVAGGHVGHRAPGREIRQDDLLVRSAEHVGALGHEVHAAEDDELGRAFAGRGARELQRVAGEVGELDDLVALIVMTEDDQAIPERLLGRRDAGVHLVVREPQEVFRERLALADALLLDLS